MKMNKRMILLGINTALMSGCASMVSQSSWPVAIKSNPEGAIFTITNKEGEKVHTGTTPSTVHLLSGAGFFEDEIYTLHFRKAGYTKTTIQEKTETLGTSLNYWYWGNLFFGPLAPVGFLIVDPETGAMFRLPKSFNIDLTAQIINSNDVPQLKDQPTPVK